MSELDLAAIRARADAATPGPWKLWGMSVLADPVGDSNLDTAILVANTAFRDANGRLRTNDADFIAAARTDVPALLAEVERLTRIVNGYDRTPAEQRAAEAEAEVERLRAEVRRLRDYLDLPICRNPGCMVVYFGGDVCPGCGHTEAGERLPSDPPSVPTQVDADADVSPVASAFRPPLLDEWCRRHEDNPPPIGPPFAMPTQIVGPLTWIRCPRCAWPMVEGLCGQCGFEDRDYVDDAYDDDTTEGRIR